MHFLINIRTLLYEIGQFGLVLAIIAILQWCDKGHGAVYLFWYIFIVKYTVFKWRLQMVCCKLRQTPFSNESRVSNGGDIPSSNDGVVGV